MSDGIPRPYQLSLTLTALSILHSSPRHLAIPLSTTYSSFHPYARHASPHPSVIARKPTAPPSPPSRMPAEAPPADTAGGPPTCSPETLYTFVVGRPPGPELGYAAERGDVHGQVAGSLPEDQVALADHGDVDRDSGASARAKKRRKVQRRSKVSEIWFPRAEMAFCTCESPISLCVFPPSSSSFGGRPPLQNISPRRFEWTPTICSSCPLLYPRPCRTAHNFEHALTSSSRRHRYPSQRTDQDQVLWPSTGAQRTYRRHLHTCHPPVV